MKLKTLRQGRPFEQLSNNEMLEIIIEHIKLVCEILNQPSADITTSEGLLQVYMKVFYCDHHRHFKDFVIKEEYFDKMTSAFTRRVGEAYRAKLLTPN